MSAAERAIRWSTVAAVVLVAAVAGIVSYLHALAVVSAHGETGVVGELYPGTIDGLIYAASMVLLDAARRGRRPPGLARWLLGAGIAATLAANILARIAYGPLGAVVGAWPALALVGSYELLMLLVRSAAGPGVSKNTVKNSPHGGGNLTPESDTADAVPSSAVEAAKASMSATLAAGNPLSVNQLAERFSLTRAQATKTRRDVLAASNGHAPAE